jgi:hypothetical protein
MRWFIALAAATALAAAPCPKPPAFYEEAGYVVAAVRIATVFPGRQPAPPPLAGQPFTIAAWQAPQASLAAAPEAGSLRLVLPQIENCDDAQRQLTVVYRWLSLPNFSRWLRLPGSLTGNRLHALGLWAPPAQPITQRGPCGNAGITYPLHRRATPEYAWQHTLIASACGPTGLRASFHLFSPEIGSTYTLYPGAPARHHFQSAAGLTVGPLSLRAQLEATLPERRHSFRLAVAAPLWRRPLLPAAIRQDAGLAQAIELGLAASESALADSYLADSAEFQALAAKLVTVRDILRGLPPLPPRSTPRQRLTRALAKLDAALASPPPSPAAFRGLVIDFVSPGTPLPPVPALLPELVASLAQLERRMPELALPVARLERLLYDLQHDFEILENTPLAAQATTRARDEVNHSRRLLHRLIHGANFLAAGPALVAASTERQGWTLGPGLRFTVLAVDVTAGYGWRLSPQRSPARGALFVAVDLNNILRF